MRRHYETGFALMPDCRCDLRTLTGHSGRAVAESLFHGTRPRFGKVIEAIGAEVADIVDGRIKRSATIIVHSLRRLRKEYRKPAAELSVWSVGVRLCEGISPGRLGSDPTLLGVHGFYLRLNVDVLLE